MSKFASISTPIECLCGSCGEQANIQAAYRGEDCYTIVVDHCECKPKSEIELAAIGLLWLFDTDPRVQEFLKEHGLWGTSKSAELAQTASNK